MSNHRKPATKASAKKKAAKASAKKRLRPGSAAAVIAALKELEGNPIKFAE